MAQFLKNYGLDFIMDNEETFFNFIGLLAQEGKAKKTYSGSPYLYKSLGHVEFTVNTELNHKKNFRLRAFQPTAEILVCGK